MNDTYSSDFVLHGELYYDDMKKKKSKEKKKKGEGVGREGLEFKRSRRFEDRP